MYSVLFFVLAPCLLSDCIWLWSFLGMNSLAYKPFIRILDGQCCPIFDMTCMAAGVGGGLGRTINSGSWFMLIFKLIVSVFSWWCSCGCRCWWFCGLFLCLLVLFLLWLLLFWVLFFWCFSVCFLFFVLLLLLMSLLVLSLLQLLAYLLFCLFVAFPLPKNRCHLFGGAFQRWWVNDLDQTCSRYNMTEGAEPENGIQPHGAPQRLYIIGVQWLYSGIFWV